MKIAVVGSRDWEDYPTLMRKLTVELEDWALRNDESDKLIFVHTGSQGAENMVTEWVGKVEKLLKQNGRQISDTVFYAKDKLNRDFELAMSDIDKALIFQKKGCKRTERFARMVEANMIPVTIVKE